MITINCKIVITAYANYQECNEIMDFGSREFGAIGPEIIFPLRLINGRSFDFKFRENATIKTLVNAIKREMDDIWANYHYWDFLKWSVISEDGEERYYLDDWEINLPSFLRNYFDYPDNSEIVIQLLISGDSGEVDNEEGILYYIYSHEKGKHHLPHVHVNTTDHDHSAVITIHDGEIIEGYLPGKKRKKAKMHILDNKEYFYDCWNKLTDGIRVDVNKHFKLIGY